MKLIFSVGTLLCLKTWELWDEGIHPELADYDSDSMFYYLDNDPRVLGIIPGGKNRDPAYPYVHKDHVTSDQLFFLYNKLITRRKQL